MLITKKEKNWANWDDMSTAKHRTQTQPCCYGSLLKCDKYWTAGYYCVLLLRMKPYDFFQPSSHPNPPDKTICHFIQQNKIVWAMVSSDWTINSHAECKEIELQPWFKHHYYMAHGGICQDRMVEGIKMKSNSEWNKRAGMGRGGTDKPKSRGAIGTWWRLVGGQLMFFMDVITERTPTLQWMALHPCTYVDSGCFQKGTWTWEGRVLVVGEELAGRE